MLDSDMLRKIAVDCDIRNAKGAYAMDIVKEVIKFHTMYVSLYLSTMGTYKKLVIPWGMFVLSLQKILTKIKGKYPSRHKVNDYIDIYNSLLANRLNNTLSKIKTHTRREFIECLDEKYSKEFIREYVPKVREGNLKIPKFFNQIVTITQGEFLGQDGLVIKNDNSSLTLKLLKSAKVIKITKSKVIIKN